eukprot:SM000391S15187  [mRNA]  locus=s391:20608:23116:+ [translate_table: standard]
MGEFRCFVGGLAWATDDARLGDAFRSFGEVIDAKVINDRETGRSRGFGFVTFADEQAMNAAIGEMNGKELDGRSITDEQELLCRLHDVGLLKDPWHTPPLPGVAAFTAYVAVLYADRELQLADTGLVPADA